MYVVLEEGGQALKRDWTDPLHPSKGGRGGVIERVRPMRGCASELVVVAGICGFCVALGVSPPSPSKAPEVSPY